MRETRKDMIKRMFAHHENRVRPSKVTWDMYFLHTGFFYNHSQENRYLKIKKQRR